MKAMFSLINQAQTILLRNFLLVYPYMLFSLLVSSMLSVAVAGGLAGLAQYGYAAPIALVAIMVLLYAAFNAGWLNLIRLSVLRFHRIKEETGLPDTSERHPANIRVPFVGTFLAGIGEFFIPVLFVNLVQFLVFIAVFALVSWLAMTQLGSFAWLEAFIRQNPAPDADQLTRFVQSLTKPQERQLEMLALYMTSGILAYATFYLLTLFWSPLIVAQNVPWFKAFGKSIWRVMTRPFHTLMYILLMVSLGLVSSIRVQMTIVDALRIFLSTMFVAFFQILLVNDVIAAMDPKERSTLWETLTKEEPKPLETNA